jgi:hypothetical protein
VFRSSDVFFIDLKESPLVTSLPVPVAEKGVTGSKNDLQDVLRLILYKITEMNDDLYKNKIGGSMKCEDETY